jgi:hypothetical protein
MKLIDTKEMIFKASWKATFVMKVVLIYLPKYLTTKVLKN